MITKGLMSDDEIAILSERFPTIYQYYIRIDNLRQNLTGDELRNMDITADIYNELINMTTSDNYILVLMSATQGNIVTDYRIYDSLNINEIFVNMVENSVEIQKHIKAGTLYFLNPTQSSFTANPFRIVSLALNVERNSLGIPKYVTAHYGFSLNDSSQPALRPSRGSIDSINEDAVLGFDNTQTSDITTFGGVNTSWLEDDNIIRLVSLIEDRIYTWDIVNTGLRIGSEMFNREYTISDKSDGSRILRPPISRYPPIVKNLTKVKRRYNFNFQKSKFDKYVSSDAQPIFFKKVRKFLNRRFNKDSEDDEKNKPFRLMTLTTNEIDGSFGGNKNLFSNYYFVPMILYPIFEKSRENNFGISKENLDKIEEFLEKGLKSYQEAVGKFKPLDRKFFEMLAKKPTSGSPTVRNPDNEYEREIFYNNIYPYLNQALGGIITGSGKRTYQPTRKSETINKSLTENERDMITYLNNTDIEEFEELINLEHEDEHEVLDLYHLFIHKIGEELENSVGGKRGSREGRHDTLEVYADQINKGYLYKHLRGLGMITTQEVIRTDRLPFFMLRLGMFGRSESRHTTNNFQNKLQSKHNKMFFILIDMFKQEIIVINYTTVNDPSRYSINFQDFDISMDLRNTVNRILREPENLVPGEGYVEVPENRLNDTGKYFHQPDEVALPFLSHERLTNQGIPDSPNTVHYEPLKVDRLTKRTKGHLLFWAKQTAFESGSEVLAFFPFDSFYHDREGQTTNRMDVCFTPLDDPIATNKFAEIVRMALLYDTDAMTLQDLRKLIFDELKSTPPAPSGPAACIYVGANMALGDSGTYFGQPSGKGEDTDFPFNFTVFGTESVSELRTNTYDWLLAQSLTLSKFNESVWFDMIQKGTIENLEKLTGKKLPFDPEEESRAYTKDSSSSNFRELYGFRADTYKSGHVWFFRNGIMEIIKSRLPFNDEVELKSFIKRMYKQYYNENPEKASATLMARRKD